MCLENYKVAHWTPFPLTCHMAREVSHTGDRNWIDTAMCTAYHHVQDAFCFGGANHTFWRRMIQKSTRKKPERDSTAAAAYAPILTALVVIAKVLGFQFVRTACFQEAISVPAVSEQRCYTAMTWEQPPNVLAVACRLSPGRRQSE